MNRFIAGALLAGMSLWSWGARAEEGERKASFEIYGFAQVDYIQDFKRMPADWNATLRPTRIPTVAGSLGSDGEAIFSARQSRLGFKGSAPVGPYDAKTKIEFDFFGRGSGTPDAAGQNGVRLRRAYGEWGPVLGGLTASLYMDDDLWPNIIDYWGPCGMVFFRNVQIRYTPMVGTHTVAIALERPGADLANYVGVDLIADNTLPDLTAQYRLAQAWGYVQVAGILRRLGHTSPGGTSPTGHVPGWGLQASSTFQLVPDRVKVSLSVNGGQGVANYMNDATPDVAAGGTLAAPVAEAVPLLGMIAYVDIAWSKIFSTAIGYARTQVSPRTLSLPDQFKVGQYASVNFLVSPFPSVLAGPEFLWGRRDNVDGSSGYDARLQVSVKYAFSSK